MMVGIRWSVHIRICVVLYHIETVCQRCLFVDVVVTTPEWPLSKDHGIRNPNPRYLLPLLHLCLSSSPLDPAAPQ